MDWETHRAPLIFVQHHLEAEFHFLTPEQGGDRVMPIYNVGRYLPQVRFESREDSKTRADYSIVQVDFHTNAEIICPGECVPCSITFASPERQEGRWHLGMEAPIHEGYHRVATCIITKVLL